MTTAEEALIADTELAAGLAAGLTTLDLNQVVVFTRYVRVVLPLDGFVFWVRADLIGPSSFYNAARLNTAGFNQGPQVTPADTITARGSLHVSTRQVQDVDSTMAINTMAFTSLVELDDFNAIAPGDVYIAELDGVRYTFNGRRSFYRQAALYHYFGDALYSIMDTQVIDDPAQFDGREPVVSNSLPLWLDLAGYSFFPPGVLSVPRLYPSFAVPTNLPPPYGAVHVVPEQTLAIGGAPILSGNLSHSQLCTDTVEVTLFGLRNSEAMAFMDAVNQYSLDTDRMGIMNMPALRNEKRTQSELVILAMKSKAVFQVSYYQSAARDVARQLILSCVPSYIIKANGLI